MNVESYKLAAELGYTYLLKGEYQNSEKEYGEAGKIDPSKSEPILSLVHIKLVKEEIEEAEASLEFLKEIFSTLEEEPSEFYFLLSVLEFKKAQRERDDQKKEEIYNQSSEFFDQALRIHIDKTKNIPNNLEFFKIFNPSFLLILTRFFMLDTNLSFTLKKMNINLNTFSDFIFKKCAKIL